MTNVKQYEFYYKLRTMPFVEQIWLYGSRSKGTEQERSDIDLAIICPSATSENWQTIRSIIDNADTLLKIDCVRFDTLKDDRLIREIEASKQVLFKRVKNNNPWYEHYLDLKEALDKFSDIIHYDKNAFPYVVEATIQVFEYTFELYWKLLKKICLQEGTAVNSPRATLQQAYVMKLIDDEQAWLEIMESRNNTSHTYQHPTANEIYIKCKQYCPIMMKNLMTIEQKYHLT